MTDDLEARLAGASPGQRLDLEGLRRAIARRAADAGLLDVAYATHDSPLGPLTVIVTPRGLLRLSYPGEPVEEQLDDVAARISPRVLAAPERTDDVRRQLDEYFGGARQAFDLPIDWRLVRGFAGGVLRATARIPFGAVSTYREIAARAGSPNAYRAAGNALGSNPVPIVVPCHRVLHAGGGLGGYTGGLDRKQYLLRLEGVLDAKGSEPMRTRARPTRRATDFSN
jgi:methylated-DNA-[protein]-cysteine S-methyltransferase